MKWSRQQEAIFEWFARPSGNLVVRARAGTGKTTTICEAVKHIQGEPRVLVCAFNKRIGDELRLRLPPAVDAKTLHSLGYTFLRGAWGNLNVDNTVEDDRIEASCDELPPWDVMIGIKKLIGIAKGSMPEGGIVEIAELCELHGCVVDDRYDPKYMANIAMGAMIRALTPDPQGRITFDDMLYIPVVKQYSLPIYDFVVVDEAQDMNFSQLVLARGALKPDGHMIVVGDDKQAIYGFRGADSNAIDRLKEELQASELGLNTTYRCGANIVREAQRLVPDFFFPEGTHTGVVDVASVTEMVELIEPGNVILSRTNAPLVPLCLGFIREGKAARIEGRDIGKMLADRAKKLKATTVEEFLVKLNRWANVATGRAVASGNNVHRKLAQINDVHQTLEALAEGCDTMQDVYARCDKMFADVGRSDSQIVLSTVHKAKGLEWDTVFLLRSTMYVYGMRPDDPEEKNIHYVAITRARHNLVLVEGRVE